MARVKNDKKLNIKSTLASIAIVFGIVFLESLLGFKTYILVSTAVSIVLAALAIWGAVEKKKKDDGYDRGESVIWAKKWPSLYATVSTAAIFIPVITAVDAMRSFSYTKAIPFVVIPLIVGIISTVVFFVFSTKDSKLWLRILWSIIIGFVAAFYCSGFIMNLNYAFDTSEPEVCTAVIIDKDRTSGSRRRSSRYDFDVAYDGEEFSLYVSRSEYKFYEVGDTVRFYKYKGAFGKPFYISESKR